MRRMDSLDPFGEARVSLDAIGRLEWDGGEQEGVAHLVQLTSGQILLGFRVSGKHELPGDQKLKFTGRTPEGDPRIVRVSGSLISSRSLSGSYRMASLNVVIGCDEASIETDSISVQLGQSLPAKRIEASLVNYFSGAARTVTVADHIVAHLEPTLIRDRHPMRRESVRRQTWGNFETHHMSVTPTGDGMNAKDVVDSLCAALTLETGESVGVYQIDVHLLNDEVVTYLRTPRLRPRTSAPITIELDVAAIATNFLRDPELRSRCSDLIDRFVDACDGSTSWITRGLVAATLIDDIVPDGAALSSELKAAAKEIRKRAKISVSGMGVKPADKRRLEKSVTNLLRSLGKESFRERLEKHLNGSSIITSDEGRQTLASKIVGSRNALVHSGHYDPKGSTEAVQW